MSRATQSKSRADKKGGQSAPTPAVTHEIVPGKYTDVDWNRMLELDDGEDFITDVVDEVLEATMKIIYDKYIERQLLPYTISQAKEALLTIIDWRFLACDAGEVDPSTDPTWQEDEEPVAAVPDCWAQGSVPKSIVTKREPSVASVREEDEAIMEVQEPVGEDDAEVVLDEQCRPWEVNEDLITATEQFEEEVTRENTRVSEPISPAKVPSPPSTKNKKKFRPHKGRLRSAGVRDMVESLDETERKLTTEERLRETLQDPQDAPSQTFNPMPKSVGSILKFQSGRPPGNRDVYYDEQGNVVAMSKIHPDKLPTHRIKTKYHIVDPETEAAQARLDAMRTGRSLSTKPKKRMPPASDRTKLEQSSILDYRSVQSGASTIHRRKQTGAQGSRQTDTMTPLPPPMIESMELAPGVMVREGDRVKRGPRQMTRTSDRLPQREALRPVGVEPDLTISVKELLGSKSPLVRIEPTPVPPINNRDVRPKIRT